MNKDLPRMILSVLLTTLVAACGGGGGGGGGDETVSGSNSAPQVTAVGDMQVNGGETIVLSAFGSDVDGDAITYEWVQTAGARVRLDDPQAATTTFLAPTAGGSLNFSVQVSDGTKSAAANVGVNVEPYSGGSVVLSQNPVRNNVAVSGTSVTVDGGVAYVGSGADGLIIFDATQSTPTQIGSYTDLVTDFRAGRVLANGTLAVASGSVYVNSYTRKGVLRLLDVSTPSAPTFLSDIDLSSYNDLALTSDHSHLYIATYLQGFWGLKIEDLTDPANPVEIAIDTTINPALALNIKDIELVQTATKDLLYASSGSNLYVFDVTDPANITTLTTVNTGAVYNSMVVEGTTLYAGVSAGETTSFVDFFDISNPESPVKTDTWTSTTGYVIKLAVANNQLFVEGSYTASVLDVSNPAAPALVGQYTSSGVLSDIELYNSRLFVVYRDWGLMQAFDVSQPSFQKTLPVVAQVDTGGHIAARNSTLFVTDNNGLHAYDLSDPSVPMKLGSYTGGTYSPRGVVLNGLTAILPDYTGLRFVDITDLTAMKLAGEFDTWSTHFNSIAVNGNYAYAGIDTYYKVYTFDISDRTNPVQLGSDTLDTGYSDITQVLVDGDALHVASRGGVASADLTNPADPVFANSGITSLSGYFDDVTSTADRLILSSPSSGITLADTSDITQVSSIGGYGYSVESIALSGRYVYISSWYTGELIVVDIADPANPALAGYLMLPEKGKDITVVAGHLYAVTDTSVAVMQSEPELSTRYATGLVGETLSYTVSWDEFPSSEDTKVACKVTGDELGGQCAVTEINQTNRTALVSWTLPSTAGDYEIVIAVADQHSFITTRDRVKAQ